MVINRPSSSPMRRARCVLCVNLHDSLECMFFVPSGFLVSGEIENVVPMVVEKPAAKRHKTRGIVILEPEAGWT